MASFRENDAHHANTLRERALEGMKRQSRDSSFGTSESKITVPPKKIATVSPGSYGEYVFGCFAAVPVSIRATAEQRHSSFPGARPTH